MKLLRAGSQFYCTLGALVTNLGNVCTLLSRIFLDGPYIEKWRGNDDTTLSAVTGSVVVVVLNLVVCFGLHVIFSREWCDQLVRHRCWPRLR